MDRYTLYVDESGTANLNDKRDDLFFLTGLILENNTSRSFSDYFQLVKKRHGIETTRNFHSVEFFEIKQNEQYVSNKKAKDFSYTLGEVLDTLPTTVFSYQLDKNTLRKVLKIPEDYDFKGTTKEHKADKEIAYELLARKIFFDFAQFLNKKNAKGNIVAESRNVSDSILLKTFFECKNPDYFNNTPRFASYANNFNEKVVSICFENKNAVTAGLEIADTISYLWYLDIKGKMGESFAQKRGLVALCKELHKNAKKPTLVTGPMIHSIGRDRINKITKEIKKFSLNKLSSRSPVDPT
jgi:hypothetical protein